MNKKYQLLKYILVTFIFTICTMWTSSVYADEKCQFDGGANIDYDDVSYAINIKLIYNYSSNRRFFVIDPKASIVTHNGRAGSSGLLNLFETVRGTFPVTINSCSDMTVDAIEINENSIINLHVTDSGASSLFTLKATSVTGSYDVTEIMCPVRTIECALDSSSPQCITNEATVKKYPGDGGGYTATVRVPVINSGGSWDYVLCSSSSDGNCNNIASQFIAGDTLVCPSGDGELFIAKNPASNASALISKEQALSYINNGWSPDDIASGAESGATLPGQLIPNITFGDNISCVSLKKTGIIDDINWVLDVIKILVPFAIIALGGLDFAKAVMGQKDDDLKKATNSFIKRLVAGVIFFFVPTILRILFDAAGLSEFLCGIGVIMRVL